MWFLLDYLIVTLVLTDGLGRLLGSDSCQGLPDEYHRGRVGGRGQCVQVRKSRGVGIWCCVCFLSALGF